MICTGLRLKRKGKKSRVETIALIEEVLAEDEETFSDSKPIGRMARRLGQFPDPSQATDFLVSKTKITVEKLRSFCKALRLPVTGKKGVLAQQFTEELLAIWNLINVQEQQHEQEQQQLQLQQQQEQQEQQQLQLQAQQQQLQLQAQQQEQQQAQAAVEVAAPEVQAAVYAAPEQEQGAVAYTQQQGEWRHDAQQGEWSQGEVQEAEVSWAASSAPPEANGTVYRRSAAPAEVEVVETQAIGDSSAVKNQKKESRRAERRMKLMGYLVEEVATIYGDEKDRYMSDMKSMLQGVPDEARMAYCTDKLEEPTHALVSQRVPSVLGDLDEAPEFGAWHSEPHQYEMQMVGEVGPCRQAWCKWWDSSTGCGELVDLVDSNPVAVVSAALSTGANVSPRLKSLRQGEFVEYRRVDRGEHQISRAILVRGIKGWPLMCEVDTSRILGE